MKYRLVIFDLDGTTLNTLADLTNAVNHALSKRGYPTHSIEAIRMRVGNGVANLIRWCVPEGTDEAEIAAALADFKAYYAANVNVETKPYAGIPELLRTLHDAGMRIGINSNKYEAAMQTLCVSHFANLYDYAVGESEITPKKPDPTGAMRIMSALGVSADETVFVGDSSVDLRTAANIGCDAAWVSWGFRSREDMSGFQIENAFDDVDALKEFLLQ